LYSLPSDQVKEDKIGRAFSTHGEKEYVQAIGVKARRKERSKNNFP
jgi:hypothetical protein